MANNLRAAVLQFPVGIDVASNLECLTACVDQLEKCPSMIVSPSGTVLAEVAIGSEGKDAFDEVSDWVLSQARSDVVAVSALE